MESESWGKDQRAGGVAWRLACLAWKLGWSGRFGKYKLGLKIETRIIGREHFKFKTLSCWYYLTPIRMMAIK